MNISLTPEQEKFIHQLVESGKYRAASDAVSQAVRLLQDRYMVAELQKEITIGIEQLDRGEKVDGETAIQKLRNDIITRSGQQ